MKLLDWIGFLSLVISLAILWQFRQILLLVFTAAVLAIALNSLVRWLMQTFNLRRQWGVLGALLIVLLGAAVFVGVVVPPFIQQFQELILLVPQGLDQLLTWADEVIQNPPAWLPQPGVEDLPSLSEVARQLGSITQQVFGNFFAFFSGSVAVVLQVFLIAVLTLMMLAEPLAYRRLLLRLFPSFYRRRADEIFSLCERSLLGWLAGISLSSVFIAITSGVGLVALGIPLVYAHALLAGVSNLVPNVGPTLSVIFPVAVALLNSPSKAIAVVVLYIMMQNLESYWFSPLVMRQQVSLLPAATLIAQIFFASFLGPLGLLLAVPLAVIVKIWVEEAFIKDVLDFWKTPPSRMADSAQLALETASGSPALPHPADVDLEPNMQGKKDVSSSEPTNLASDAENSQADQ
ncbi:MAG: AI-2E family transporter [Elainellaceae cyanobacterium]